MAVKFNEKKSNRIEKRLYKDFDIITLVRDDANNVSCDEMDAFEECTALLKKKKTINLNFHRVKDGILISRFEWSPETAQKIFDIINKNYYDGMKLEKEEVEWLESFGIV